MRAELGLSLRGHREVWRGGARDQPRLSPNAPSQCKRTQDQGRAQAVAAPEGDRKGPSGSSQVKTQMILLMRVGMGTHEPEEWKGKGR